MQHKLQYFNSGSSSESFSRRDMSGRLNSSASESTSAGAGTRSGSKISCKVVAVPPARGPGSGRRRPASASAAAPGSEPARDAVRDCTGKGRPSVPFTGSGKDQDPIFRARSFKPMQFSMKILELGVRRRRRPGRLPGPPVSLQPARTARPVAL